MKIRSGIPDLKTKMKKTQTRPLTFSQDSFLSVFTIEENKIYLVIGKKSDVILKDSKVTEAMINKR